MVPSCSETLRRKEWQVGQMLLGGEMGGATKEAGLAIVTGGALESREEDAAL